MVQNPLGQSDDTAGVALQSMTYYGVYEVPVRTIKATAPLRWSHIFAGRTPDEVYATQATQEKLAA